MSKRKLKRTNPMYDLASVWSNGEATPLDDITREARWIRRKIYMRKCARFVPVKVGKLSLPTDENMCACGYPKSDHSRGSLLNPSTPIQWSVDEDTETYLTNAFGEIEFVGFADIQRKYVRVDVNTPEKTMVDLMMKCWRLKPPNLLISVTGGAKNFQMKSNLREVFRRGLVKVSRCTDAWIITGGTNAGVMKHVGEAVRDYRLTTSPNNHVVAIGIATWGCIKNNEHLCDDMGEGKWPARYKTEISRKHESSLEPNHTHFILVDDGTKGQFGVDIKFRAQLERAVAERKTRKRETAAIPIVLLLVEGGMGSLQSVYESILHGTPVVVVKGSGRVADIIAYAYQHSQEIELEETLTDNTVKSRMCSYVDNSLTMKLTTMLTDIFGSEHTEKNINHLLGCLEQRDLITVFDISSSMTSSSRDIDVAILKSLMKANKEAVFNQLKLALSWNRTDIAKSEIFTEERIWQTGSLDEIFFEAILTNKTDFVELLMDNGVVSLTDFLTEEKLVHLYNSVPQRSLLRKCLAKMKNRYRSKTESITLKDVRRFIKLLIGVNMNPYHKIQYSWQGSRGETKMRKERLATEDFFLWAVLMNYQDMAKLFWKHGKDSTAYALIAFGILRGLANKTDDTEMRNTLQLNSEEFSDLAVGVLTECFESDERKTNALLIRQLDYCDGILLLDIALNTYNLQFISHKACQAFYRDVWMGNLAHDTSIVKLLVSPVFLGLFVLKVIQPVRSVDDAASKYDDCSIRETDDQKQGKGNADSEDEMEEDDTNSIDSPLRMGRGLVERVRYRVWSFYTAPIMVFAHNIIAYCIFLALFSYMILTEFSEEVGKVEFVIYIWVFNIFVEQVRKFGSFLINRRTAKSRSVFVCVRRIVAATKLFLADDWNKMDLFTFTIFLSAVLCRHHSDGLEVSRIVLAFSLMFFFFRLLHIFSVHKELGPKIVMIRRMMVDLTFFLIILLVFMCSYAIAIYSILYPNDVMSISMVKDILRVGYWNLYGQFFFEEIEISGYNCTHSNDPLTTYMENGEVYTCPLHRDVALILMGTYALFSNVLLLNILIAMFSNTFQAVQDNTDRLWNYMRCSLIKEFHTKPCLPPPLSLPIYLWIFLKWICYNTFGCCDPYYDKDMQSLDRELIQWENVIADSYFQRLQTGEQNKTENRVKHISKRLDQVTAIMSDSHYVDDIASQMEKRFEALNEKMDTIVNLLNQPTCIKKSVIDTKGEPQEGKSYRKLNSV